MNFAELFLLAAGLAMDACAVSVTNGMYDRTIRVYRAAAIGLCFGLMQGIMPLAGFLLGSVFYSRIAAYDHYMALLLLCGIGGKMIVESLHCQTDAPEQTVTLRLIMLQGVATSVDALAVGIGFSAFRDFRILPALLLITGVTAVMSFAGVYIGKQFGTVLCRKAQIGGGILLIAIGLRIFVSHTLFT